LRSILTILALISPAAEGAGQAASASGKNIQSIALLPDGSQLQGVMLPRFDENRNLVGVLKAGAMTLVNAGQIAGETVSIEFFNPDRSPRGRIDLARATFLQEKGFLVTNDPVKIQTDRVTASGNGLYYAFERGQGFMPGPATTTLKNPTETTTMHAPHSSLRATAVVGLSLITQSLVASPPPPLTAAETASLRADASPKALVAGAAVASAHASLDADLAASTAASQAAASFLATVDLPVPAADEPASAPFVPQSGPDETVIDCQGGMYFDADEGVLVYLKNVTVKNPRFDLSGANELKIFFGKKRAAKAAAKPGDASPTSSGDPTEKTPTKLVAGFGKNVGGNFGDVERIVATGAVKIDQRAAAGKEALKASGAIFSYNLKAGQIILSGGYPWFTQGTTYMRAKEPNLILRIFPKTGTFVTEGNWEMGGNLEKKR
jgi:hypothetical protein